MKMLCRTFVQILMAMMLAGLVGCSDKDQATVKVNLKQTDPAGQISSSMQEKPLRIGMGAMITPKEGYIYYQRLQAYLAKKLNRPVQLVDRANYDEINELLGSKGIDAAFVCAGPYVEGKKKIGMELLAMPVVKGKPVYHAYIIVHRDSQYRKFADLKGKVFAFTDPKSNTGKLVPTYMLARMGETPESFFGRFIYTYGHDNSIKAVAERHVDGAAVDSLIWEYAALKNQALTDQTRIITKSDPYGIPPVVVRNDMDPVLKKRLKEVFLQLHTEQEGKEILTGMMIDRFIPGDDANYDTIRAMNSWIANTQKKVK